MQIRPRRSVLYMPGSNARALEKAKGIAADVLILDLEDAVAPEQKVAAREQVMGAVRAGGYGHRELVIRINGLDTPWAAADLQAVAGSGAAAVCMPKVESAAQIEHVAAQLRQQGARASMAIWAMIETPRGVLNAAAIANAPRMAALVLGTSDLAKDLRVPHTPDRLGFITSLGLAVLAARAAGIDVLDGVHLDLKDPVGLRAACEQGRNLGFDGKTVIHPDQVAIANEVFAPDAAAVERARRLLAVWQEAQAQGQGVAVLDGKLVESLHAVEAERLLAIADAVAALSGGSGS
jgi:citrate lyase subunit beta/citryl-CoA lyase